jgi:hypothetical protein
MAGIRTVVVGDEQGQRHQHDDGRADSIGHSSCPELGLTLFVEGVMSAVEKQTEPMASVCMVENNAAFADFLLLKEQM